MSSRGVSRAQRRPQSSLAGHIPAYRSMHGRPGYGLTPSQGTTYPLGFMELQKFPMNLNAQNLPCQFVLNARGYGGSSTALEKCRLSGRPPPALLQYNSSGSFHLPLWRLFSRRFRSHDVPKSCRNEADHSALKATHRNQSAKRGGGTPSRRIAPWCLRTVHVI